MPTARELEDLYGSYRGAMPCPDDFDSFWRDRMGEADAVELDFELEPAKVASPATCDYLDLWYTGMRGARLHAK